MVTSAPAGYRVAESGLLVPADIGETRAATSEQIWLEVYGSLQSQAGKRVTIDRALQVSTVLACARVLAEGIAQIPLKIYQASEDGRNRRVAREHPLYDLLHDAPNSWQTSYEWRETLMMHAVLTGNAVSYKTMARGQIREIIPLLPGWLTIAQSEDFTLEYTYRPGQQQAQTFSSAQVLHIRGASWNAYAGMEAIRLAREAIGLAMATEEHAARLHGQAARPAGILTTDQSLGEKARQNVKESWQSAFTGDNLYKTAVLEAGLKWTPLSMTGVDAQHIETRRHQIEEICRIFRVFPQMVGFTDKTSTYASAEQFFLAHVVHSLMPWAVRLEQAMQRDLLTRQERAQGYFVKFAMQGLLRGDAKTRAEFYQSGITNGWLTRNEARQAEEYDALTGLDTPLMPLNMTDGTQMPVAPTPGGN